MKPWTPPTELSSREQRIMKRLQRSRKLFAFLRLHRHQIFDDAFQRELEATYRQTGAGEKPVPPAVLCLVILLQAYLGTSDAEAVEMTILDLRWQMVLDCLGSEEPAFGQATLQQFRERLIAHDLDRRLLERTIDLAKETKEFDWKKLPKSLRLGVDSRPFEGAGRVEDTFNLLGHAARKVVQLAASLTDIPFDRLCQEAGVPLLLAPSIKTALDINWSDPEQKDWALLVLVAQIDTLTAWLHRHQLALDHPLASYIEAIAQVRRQDVERKNDKTQLRHGPIPDRQISIEDPEMRHGRKSSSQLVAGYKQHLAADLDSQLIHACSVTPANRPEQEGTAQMIDDLEHQGATIAELFVDGAYAASPLAIAVEKSGGRVVAKPRVVGRHPDHFNKNEFTFNLRDRTITCPAGAVESFRFGATVEFDAETCAACFARPCCTSASPERGRTIHVAADEQRQQRFRKQQATGRGRDELRTRTGIEHRLAHLAARQGPIARYRGTRKNLFDLRRMAALQNLETIQRRVANAA
jgi:Transposase DDE domain/Transposase domain (DUF772)